MFILLFNLAFNPKILYHIYISTRPQAVELCEQVIEMCGTESINPSTTRLDMKVVQQSLEDTLCGVSRDVAAVEVKTRKRRKNLKHCPGQNQAGDT